MNLSVGIVGLPNVGKSTLFNALLKKQQALVANYPFATIEPNVGIVPVPDERLLKLAEVTKAEEKMEKLPPIIPATVKFVDIAGLVRGAAEGAGLGNKFLANIREVDLICHVIRGFVDNDIVREGSTDPVSDRSIINTELVLADLATLQNQAAKLKDPKVSPVFKSVVEKLLAELDLGKLASEVGLDEEESAEVKSLQLLTAKPVLYVLNVSYEEDRSANPLSDNTIEIDAKLEAELAALSEEEQREYLKSLNLSEPGLNRLARKVYEMLGLISFLTTGEKETKAWTITRGLRAPQAAGTIHTDFEKNFIKAEVVAFEDFVAVGGWKGARDLGKVRLEGRDYSVRDGDVIEFKIGN